MSWKKVYDWISSTKIFPSIIRGLPSAWSVFISFIDKCSSNYFTDVFYNYTTSSFTKFTIAISIFFVLLYFFYVLLRYRFTKKVEDNITIITSVLEGINAIINTKLTQYKTDIKQHSKITNSCDHQINIIITELQIAISKIMNVDRRNIGISIIYRKKVNNTFQWEVLHEINLQKYESKASIEDLVNKNSNSTLNEIIRQRKDEVFYVDKNQAYKDGHYYIKGNPEDNDLSGSIYCKNLKYDYTKHAKHKAILCISTYNVAICVDDEDIKKIFTDVVVKPFADRLVLELSNKDF